MQIFVIQTWNGSVESLKVKPHDTIGNIKSKISAKLGKPTDDQILLYEQRPLQDMYTLLEYRIQEQAILQLQLRLRGWKLNTYLDGFFICMLFLPQTISIHTVVYKSFIVRKFHVKTS